MNLKQALKKKNLLLAEIKQELNKVATYNSIEVGNRRPYSAKEAFDKYMNLTNELINLKTAIHIANAPVYNKIFRLSELKNMANAIKSIDCTDGKEPNRFHMSGESRIMNAEISIVTRDTMVKDIEKEINDIQDELDYFNATTEVNL